MANKKIHVGYKTLQIIICIALAVSCGRSFDTKKELMAYVHDPDHGYHLEKEVNGIHYGLTYRPTDLLVDQEWDGKDLGQLDSLRAKYGDYLYFTLSLSKGGQEVLNGLAGDRQRFGAMVNQLAFGMGEKVHVYSQAKDTVELADYIYPRMYGMGGGNRILLVYPRDSRLFEYDKLHLTIEDLGLATGEVHFKVPTTPLKAEPRLAFDAITE